MSFSENEMRGLLTGKCIPGDMKVNEELPAYLVRKFDALQEQVQNLAAENAVLAENVALKKCCEPTEYELKLLREGDYTPEELWGVDGRKSCPKCAGSKS
jgi:hypothetical protein